MELKAFLRKVEPHSFQIITMKGMVISTTTTTNSRKEWVLNVRVESSPLGLALGDITCCL